MCSSPSAERRAAQVPDVPRDTPVRNVMSVGVVGAGTMGGGIAMCFANIGVPVTLLDVSEEAVKQGLAIIAKNYAHSVKRGRLAREEMDRRMSLIRPTTDYQDFASADLVVEAVDVDRIAAATSRPHDVVGMHFFSPANIMRLLEVVRGGRTSKDVIATALAAGRRIGKVAVLVGNCDGFAGNRMIKVYGTEVQRLVEEGASPGEIDSVMTGFGLAMGPFAQSDLAGNDVAWRIRQRCLAEGKEYGTPLLDRLHELGRLGQKTGAGWFRYEPGSRTPQPDEAVRDLIEAYRRERGIALRASDIDVIYVNGYGFPSWRGGPMKYADLTGLHRVLADIRALHARHGAGWAPAPLLERLAAAGQCFADYDRRAPGPAPRIMEAAR
ncbi:MAG TPA: 3-hydroxyacyl-CoA dehydrogenase NAD-binding domain-containing protein [Steroidobacteraceae bacterium]|nr:3-hydroxyacyl-CoA dehydrogenase NAD-binding domain-containing protein [Steroidobacteraceae bacterium]